MWSNTVFRVWYIFICNKGSNPLRYLHKFGAILLALYFCIQYSYERDFYFLRIKTKGDPSSKDGDTTAVDGNQGPALPWEQSAQMQG